MPQQTVLVVDDRPNVLGLIRRVLTDEVRVLTAGCGRDALDVLAGQPVSVVLCDLRMPDMEGLEVLRECKRSRPATEFIVMTAYASVSSAVEALRLGAYDYITKPFEPDSLRDTIRRALDKHEPDAAEPALSPAQDSADASDLADFTWHEAMERVREGAARRYLAALMERFPGRVPEAAVHAGVERESLYRLLRRYGVRCD